jgi:hypothetical protein
VLRKESAGLILVLLATLASVSAEAPKIDSFYIVRQQFSDVSSGYGELVSWDPLLEVVPVDGGVRVRVIRLSSNSACKGVFVEAAERIIPKATVASISGVDLCAIDEKRAAATLHRSRVESMVVYAGENDQVVTTCHDRVHVLDLPDSNFYDMKSLRSRDRTLAQAMDLLTRVWDRAFGSDSPFDPSGSNSTPERQKAAAAAVADLKAGRFPEVLGAEFRNDLVTDGPTRLLPAEAQLVEPGSLRFDSYAAVPMPPIALSARVFGDVHLRLTVVPATGVVTDVTVISGGPLLAPAASAAARAWRLTPGTATSNQIEVTLRFQPPRCDKD